MKFFSHILVVGFLFVPWKSGAVDYCLPQDDLSEIDTFLRAFEPESQTTVSTTRGRLPANWAQQLTGSDLVSVSETRGRVGLIDTHERHHFEAVSSVLRASSRNSDVVFQASFEEMMNFESFKRKVDSAKRWGNLPRFIGISFAMGSNPEVRRSLEYLREAGSMVIASSGNKGDQELHPNNQLEGVLNVGSVAVNGLVDIYSQRSAISAPVGDELLASMGGQTVSVGGTSYAQPQILAAFGDVDAVLPGVTEAEILRLMEFTALQGVNGPLINHYKMVEVAKKLRDKGWPQNRADLLSESSDIYNFDSEVYSLSSSNKTSDLRRAFLLDSTNDVLRHELVDAYRVEGFEAMAQYFESLSSDTADQRAYVQSLAQSDDPRTRQQAQRSLRQLRESADGVWTQILAQGRGYERRESLSSIAQVSDRELSSDLQKEILKSLNDKEVSTQILGWQVVAKHAENFESEAFQIPWKLAWTDPRAEVRQSAIVAAGNFGSQVQLPDFRTDENVSVRRQALFTASSYPPMQSLSYVMSFRVDADEDVRLIVDDILKQKVDGGDPFLPFLVKSFDFPAGSERARLLDLYFRYKVFFDTQPPNLRYSRARDEVYRGLAAERDPEIVSASLESLIRLGQTPEQIQRVLQERRTDAAWNK